MLSDKFAVITGGSDGIGFGIARAFAENNANILLLARDQEKLKRAADALSQYGVTIDVMAVDLSDHSSVKQAAEDILAKWPVIDVLVNNAGIARFSPFLETTESDLDMHIDLNIKAPYIFTQHLFGALAKIKDQL